MMDEVVINPNSARPETGIAVSSAEYLGIGSLDEKKNYKSNVTVYDASIGSLLFQVSGLRYHSINTREGHHVTHTYNRLAWKPDITYLSQTGLQRLKSAEIRDDSQTDIRSATKVDQLIDMVAHKKPILKVIEMNELPIGSESMWLDGCHFDKSSRAACDLYHLSSATPASLLEAQEKYGSGDTKLSLWDPTGSPQDFAASETDFDLAIVKLVCV